MALYLIAFNDEWVPELTLEQLREAGRAGEGVCDETVVFSVDPSSGTALFTDGPFVETKEHLGGFAVVDVADDTAARYWAGRIAMAVGWPQEVHRFPHRAGVLADHQAEAASSGR